MNFCNDYEKVLKDPSLQARFSEILRNAENNGEEGIKESLVQFARDEGFEITVE